MSDPIAMLRDCIDVESLGASGRHVVEALAELEQRIELTERSAEWQKKTGGVVIFLADGHVTLEWFEAELRSVDGENLAAALDAAGAP